MRRLLNTLFVISFGVAMTLPITAQEGAKAPEAQMSGKQSAGMGDNDSTFVKKAARGGLAEVELGNLALQKASSEAVKEFGQRMVNDHTKANDQLKQVAAEKQIELPQGLNAKDKALKARLEKLSGERFDKAYMQDMVKDHKTDVAEFEQEASMGKDPAIKSFAAQTLPTLKEHLQAAQKIVPKKQEAERTSGQ